MKWVEVDLSVIAQNTRWLASQLGNDCRLMAVVKADAYGHGIIAASRTALKNGASFLGVRDLNEAAELRAAGVTAPIVTLAPIFPEQAAEAARLAVTATIDNLEIARALNKAAKSRIIDVHLDVDFGLGRWGAPPSAIPRLVAQLKKLRRIHLAGIATHIGYVPGKNAIEAEEKLNAFHRLVAPLKAKNPKLIARAVNSTVFVDFPHHRFDMVCVGNLLYGINKSKSHPVPNKMPWKFYARVASIREARKGESIGYASEYIAPRRMRVAAIAVGYADGLTMEPAERLIGIGTGFRYWGMFGATRLPFIGRCGITHVLVDATDAPRLKVGDAVALPVRRTAARGVARVYLNLR